MQFFICIIYGFAIVEPVRDIQLYQQESDINNKATDVNMYIIICSNCL